MTSSHPFKTIFVMSPGDMGHAVGRALRKAGYEIITSLEKRSEHTRALAREAGIEDAGSLSAALGAADLVLSIMSPVAAEPFSEQVARALSETDKRPVFADCNAIAPETMQRIADRLASSGLRVIDVGIIGPAPGRGNPRFYASGENANLLSDLGCDEITVRVVGQKIGQASGLKMVYAGMTKGLFTLMTTVLTVAQQLDLLRPLIDELEESQTDLAKRMRAIVPFLPADAARWIGEMEEIARTFESAGVTPDFHHAAADMFRVLEATPFASETRQTLDRTRTVEAAVAEYAKHLSNSTHRK